ncbi:putative signal peptide protein [Candidatus Burkholderia humilis]|nr:putative signal peptide protein [Candidatus Burkholderia humilis]
MNKVSKISVLPGALMIGGVMASGAAMAGVSVGVNIGVPAPVYVAPAPVYAPPPPPVVYAPPPPPVYRNRRLSSVGMAIVIGMAVATGIATTITGITDMGAGRIVVRRDMLTVMATGTAVGTAGIERSVLANQKQSAAHMT